MEITKLQKILINLLIRKLKINIYFFVIILYKIISNKKSSSIPPVSLKTSLGVQTIVSHRKSNEVFTNIKSPVNTLNLLF